MQYVINKRTRIILIAAVFVIMVSVAILLINSIDNTEKKDSDGYYKTAQDKWPHNEHTKGYPEFNGEVYAVLVTDTSTAVFIQNVESAAADSYVSLLSSSELNLIGDSYPKSAQTESLFVTVAYDAGTHRLSVTFSLKEELSQ
ncbi:MAG: hypothetical protein CVU97_00425 [Firmicutes bacterium HGW-Firmicutes-21]|nr:MAG: hypothetical protein CVU97_00425 [Firmicutes bacterium HGW-Firmicutes-21]